MKVYYEIFRPDVECNHTDGQYVVLVGFCKKCGNEIDVTKND